MNEWTKRDQARVEFLDAAVEFFRKWDERTATPNRLLDVPSDEALKRAWMKYRDLIDGKEENAELTGGICPHCGAERPNWNWHYVGVVVMGIGAIQYFNVYCSNEACRKLVAVAVAGFAPEAMLIEQALRQMKGKRTA